MTSTERENEYVDSWGVRRGMKRGRGQKEKKERRLERIKAYALVQDSREKERRKRIEDSMK